MTSGLRRAGRRARRVALRRFRVRARGVPSLEVEEARRVLERLERIDRLRKGDASREALLAEIRQLLAEGEAWLAVEPAGTEPARAALGLCRARLEAGEAGPRRV